ncbi:MAG: heme ABC exporter ATP-binding protein CcmA [Armatimonadota bacterium]|nr:heme ABC exporter ATP-binding protein CcmA [Armatimonadota bacterium]MDR7437568.1 heme ABC exporter ATP-binding protein CcmA [Armatimonadota bacterium]MDR7472162.1 heme ABC exporter ATP-binding protein CcmA [Armatimonadota bacterium]MDR7507093.1 heme ABC exporter ATP-binding protein CcmA [Armatimonadota bacterium]MDR7508724.1 heme ABC exporter ATP-binding protein CcmA [Armatimonadota bacterium]
MDVPAVRAVNLGRRFGPVWAVRRITLTVPAGRVLLVSGPNGSGKTTLLRLLATALRPTAGGGTVFGCDLVRQADRVRPMVGLVGAAFGGYELLTARENLEFAAALWGRPQTDVDAWLRRVGLGAAADRLVRTFSQGMKRRLALARVWLGQPRLLLLDEPYAGLDPEGAALVAAMVAEVVARGGSAVIATHDRDRARALADAELVLQAGEPAALRSLAPGAPAFAAQGGRP